MMNALEPSGRTATRARTSWLIVLVLSCPMLGWGCVDSDAGGPAVGDACTSSRGEPGVLAHACGGDDDAFCEAADAEEYVCVGSRPFTCPEGQVRTSWTSCGPPPAEGGTGGQGPQVGGECTSSRNEPGIVVATQTGCLADDAFCEPTDGGGFCTGSRPFVCPEGQVRTGWTTCGEPPAQGGAGGMGGAGGAGGEGP